MPKFRVDVREIVDISYYVEAENEDDAERMVHGNVGTEADYYLNDRLVIAVEQLDD